MRVVIQRVSHASVTINGTCKSAIKEGFLVLVGIEEADNQEDADWLCKKIIGLRVFDDENGVMNKSILDTGRKSVYPDGFNQKGQSSFVYSCRPP